MQIVFPVREVCNFISSIFSFFLICISFKAEAGNLHWTDINCNHTKIMSSGNMYINKQTKNDLFGVEKYEYANENIPTASSPVRLGIYFLMCSSATSSAFKVSHSNETETFCFSCFCSTVPTTSASQLQHCAYNQFHAWIMQ